MGPVMKKKDIQPEYKIKEGRKEEMKEGRKKGGRKGGSQFFSCVAALTYYHICKELFLVL